MKKINVYKPTFLKAQALSKDMGRLRGSITGGAGNMIGFLGELVLSNQLGYKHKGTDFNYDYDLTYHGLTIDVKSKGCTSEPREEYTASVSGWNTKQKCDIYFFTRVLTTDYSTVWLLGWLPPSEFYDKATFTKKGERDPSNGWLCRADQYSVSIKELNSYESLLQYNN
jgi:hypothetical protein